MEMLSKFFYFHSDGRLRDDSGKTSLFKEKHGLENLCLMLDGTGPGIPFHYRNLRHFSREEMGNLKRVYAFSGGVFAYCVFDAWFKGAIRYPLEEYIKNASKEFVRHHLRQHSRWQIATSLVRREPPFDREILRQWTQYIFKDEYLSQSVSTLDRNFVPHLAVYGECQALDCQKSSLTMRDLLTHSVAIATLYKESTEGDQIYGDANYTKNHKEFRRDLLSRKTPMVISSMSKRRDTDDLIILNELNIQNQAVRIRTEFLGLLLGYGFPHWTRETELGFFRS